MDEKPNVMTPPSEPQLNPVTEGVERALDEAAPPESEKPGPEPQPKREYTDDEVHAAFKGVMQHFLEVCSRYYGTRSAQNCLLEARSYVNVLGAQIDAIVAMLVKKGIVTPREVSEAFGQHIVNSETVLKRNMLMDPGAQVGRRQ